ncbi:MAG: hypothetical protein IJ058_08340 [Lachnospiraceae bacterium]|nr:hypothetical protein [Lachnospiraceae bacterium]
MKKNAIYKKICIIGSILILGFAPVLSSCGKSAQSDNVSTSDTSGTEVTESDDQKTEEASDARISEQTAPFAATFDITSEASTMDFLKGDWSMTDTVGGEEFATLSINSKGDCIFRRSYDDLSVEGSLKLSRHTFFDAERNSRMEDPEYTAFDITFSDIPAKSAVSDEMGDHAPAEDSASGYFYIGRGSGSDYLSLTWIGNGNSYIFENLFQDKKRIEADAGEDKYPELQNCWVLKKKNEEYFAPATEKNTEFYAWAWESTNNSLFMQTMTVNTYEEQDEYGPRRYTAGYFTEQDDISLVRYTLSDNADLSLVFNEDRLENKYPLTMYRVAIDGQGEIKSLEELPFSYYGLYDLGTLEPEISYDDLKFTINGAEYDLRDFDSPANAIMDVFTVGEWVVVDAHVGPHSGIYYLIDLNSGIVEKTITGANLTWVGDDITTAVYSMYDTVYNFKDHVIGMTDGAEVYDIKFNSAGDQILVTDMDDKTFTFETRRVDEAMYRYADYMRHPSAYLWRTFTEQAPEDAVAFVMTNPPNDVVMRLSYAYDDIEPGSDEMVYIVALDNDTYFHLDKGDIDSKTGRFKTKKTVGEDTLKKGQSRGYMMTVPDSMPSYALYVSSGDKGGVFPISMISGETDVCSTFITASMTAEEARDTAVSGPSDSDFDLMESYAGILNLYKEAQDNKYSEDQVLDMGIESELIQHGWPFASLNDEVRYVLYDVNNDGTDELLITYFDALQDIYTSDGAQLKLAYSCPYRGELSLHEDGMLEMRFAATVSNASTTWYVLNTTVGDYLPVCEWCYTATTDDPAGSEYYTYDYDSARAGVESTYKVTGNIPVTAWEWSDEITEADYNKLKSSAPEITLPRGTPISEFTGSFR